MSPNRGESRANELFQERLRAVQAKTDRLMLLVLLAQWVLAIGISLAVSPYAWSGKVRSIHLHVQLALVLGGVLNSLPIALILLRPGWWGTRQVVAVSQMLWSALLIHLTGGRIETHFHVFGSLAFLAFYRDWRVLPTATVAVASDHLLRGLLWPESVYGIPNPEWWRFFEHAFWVAFEDVVLVLGCLRSVSEMRHMADHEARLEAVNTRIEAEVQERTAELNASRELYRSLVETTSAVAWEMDADTGEMLYMAPQAVRLFGHQDWNRLRIHPHDRAALDRAFEAARRDGRDFELEYRVLTAEDRCIDVRNVVSVVSDRGRRLLRGLLFDVTQQRKLLFELQQAQKLESVGRLAAGIAHEINTPIQFVSDNCQFMGDALKDIGVFLQEVREVQARLADGSLPAAEAQARIAGAIERADLDYLMDQLPQAIEQSAEGLQRVAAIVRSMKQFAHPEQKERIATNLNETVASTLTIARNEYKYVAELFTDFGDLPLVPCHAGELNQAILNVVVNAAHAIADRVEGTGSKGEIRVRTWCEGEHACISIGDTGGGIPEEICARIFDPFFTTKQVGRGTGQGLAIARSVVVEKHGGRIDVASEIGRGSVFTLRIPLQPIEGTSA
jgi:signal transduction histidine kinase